MYWIAVTLTVVTGVDKSLPLVFLCNISIILQSLGIVEAVAKGYRAALEREDKEGKRCTSY